MLLRLERLFLRGAAQIGLLFADGEAVCFTLEDRPREVKVDGSTSIPPGMYELRLRTRGDTYARYTRRFSWNDAGMLELVHVPGFSDVLIHCGNTAEDTRGCVLVGDSVVCGSGMLLNSVDGYRRIYERVLAELRKPRSVYIDVLSISGEKHG